MTNPTVSIDPAVRSFGPQDMDDGDDRTWSEMKRDRTEDFLDEVKGLLNILDQGGPDPEEVLNFSREARKLFSTQEIEGDLKVLQDLLEDTAVLEPGPMVEEWRRARICARMRRYIKNAEEEIMG